MANANPKMSQTAAIDAKPMSKWLIALLVFTLMATAWTAIRDDSDQANAEIELQDSSSNRQASAKPSAKITKVNQDLAQEEIVSSNAALTHSSALIPWQKLKREPSKVGAYNLFKVHSWLVIPPVKKVKPEPPPPPVAPPAPFSYMGKLEDSPKGTLYFLLANNKLYSVLMGEKIDPEWQLDSEDASTLRLTYMPLGLGQIVSKSAIQTVAAPIAAEINP
jgi:hypothetical protein